MTFLRFAGRRRLALGILTASVLAVAGCGGSDDDDNDSPPTPEALAANCNALTGQTIAGVAVTAVTRVDANVASNPAAICKVSGTRAPFLDIEVDIPDNWSGRLLHQGGGGFDGRIPSAFTLDSGGAITAISKAIVDKGAVYAASNGGNRAAVPAEAAPGIWASGTTAGQASADDYAYKAIGTTITFAKEVAKAVYGTAATRSYFNGCSNGGRNAYIAAQRWPDQYDGIVSGCETMDMTGQTAAWMNLGSKAGTPAALTAEQFSASHAAALAACDANDGVADGLMAHPASCTFSPAALQCGAATANPDPALCLSAAQVTTLQSLLSDLVLANGSVAYSKFSWANFSSFGPAFGSLGGGFALLASNDPAWLTTAKHNTFDLNRDYYVFGNGLLRIGADHDKASIASYVASGKKLISWHAGSDNLLSANDHMRNYATMLGIAQGFGLSDPRTNTRFFIVPGAAHGGGAALTQVDWFDAIVNWVENNQAPTQLTYNFSSGQVPRSLPVCEAPNYPRYNGNGDVNSAANYTCTAP